MCVPRTTALLGRGLRLHLRRVVSTRPTKAKQPMTVSLCKWRKITPCALKLLLLMFVHFERERACTQKRGGGAETGAVSPEPDSGFDLPNRELMT